MRRGDLTVAILALKAASVIRGVLEQPLHGVSAFVHASVVKALADAQPGSAAPSGQTEVRPGLLGGGLFGGIAAGFLSAGLFGLCSGRDFFGGMAGFASILGLLLQVMAGRDRRPADLRLVAATHYASTCLCGGDWTQLWRS